MTDTPNLERLDPDSLEVALSGARDRLNFDASDLAKRMNAGCSAQHALGIYLRDAIPDAIATYLAAERERGYALMPREPTPAMLQACGEAAKKANPAMKGDSFKAIAWDALHIHRAMFDALASRKVTG